MYSYIRGKLLCIGISAACIGICLLTGCGSKTEQNMEKAGGQNIIVQQQEVQQPVLESNLEYEMPVSRVRVLAGRNGYQTERDKKVFFLGQNLSETFRVVNADTCEVAFTGKIQNTIYDEKLKEYVSTGDFSQLAESGNYYIETDKIGRSYTFAIQDDMYEQMLQGILASSELLSFESSPQSVCEAVLGMHTFFIALQNHGAVFEKDNHLVSWLLKMADWLMSCQAENGAIYDDYEATAAYCGIMSMCADNFGKYAEDMLKSYENAARKAWEWMGNQPEGDKKEDATFYAAAQLFKTGKGDKAYQLQVETFINKNKEKLTDNLYIFFGSALYLNTEKNINRDLCTEIMQKLVSETEKISLQVNENPYLVYTTEIDTNLRKILLVCFVDYITPSNEYIEILENTIHYMAGCNGSGSCYLNTQGQWLVREETQSWSLQWNGIILYCLSDVLDDEKE